MDVLVAGMGFVGSNAAAALIENGYSVAGIDLNPVMPDYLAPHVQMLKLHKGDVSNFEAMEETVKREEPRILVHTATYLDPGRTHDVFKVNVGGTANALETARKHDLRLVWLSSGAIYGQMEGEGDIDEEEPFGPVFPLREFDNASGVGYATSKRLGEQWLRLYRDLYGLEVIALRLGWVYGRGILDYRLNSGVSLFLSKALAGESLRLSYGGDTFCDFVHVFDVADSIVIASKSPMPRSLAFNIVYERGYWMSEVVDAVRSAVPGADISLGGGLWPSRGVSVPRGGISFPSKRHMSIARAKKEIGYAPSRDIVTGTKDSLIWMKKNWENLPRNR